VGYPALPQTISQFHREIVPCRLIYGTEGQKWAGLWAGRWAGPPAYHQSQVKSEAPAKFQDDSSKANTPFWWGGPCGPVVRLSTPKIKILYTNPPRGATFVCWPPPNSQIIHPHLVGWTLCARVKGEPPKIKFYQATPTRRAAFVCWPPPHS
jgi:hypothetical protein